MVIVAITVGELASGSISPRSVSTAARAIREEGFVVLQGVVSSESIAALRERLLDDVYLLQNRPDAPYNWNAGNIQQDPPPFAPFLFRDVLLNDMVIAVTKEVLGPGVKNHYYSGNTALRSDQRQPVHADTWHLWRGMAVAHPAHQLVVNVPLVDVTPENGSTEIWPGTHLDTTVSVHDSIEVPPGVLEQRRALSPPIQPSIRAGSVLIRDIRLWHAGMPNHTNVPRPMIAMIHAAAWLAVDTLKFPRGTEAFFEHPDLVTCAEFVDDPIDYIGAPHAYAYGQGVSETGS
jgi:ectoine hydroxylase-related dioxygenase (phytanoyl-CoA dioxygenase family)